MAGVIVNSNTAEWARNYLNGVEGPFGNRLFNLLTSRRTSFANDTANWTHLQSVITGLRQFLLRIDSALALQNVNLAAQKVENNDTYDLAAEYAVLKTGCIAALAALSPIWAEDNYAAYDVDGNPNFHVPTPAQKTAILAVIDQLLGLYDDRSA